MKTIPANAARACPHCHERELIYIGGESRRVHLRYAAVECVHCGAQGPTAIGRRHNGEGRAMLEASALKKWNKR